MPLSMQHYEDRITTWAEAQSEVRAAIVVSSMAHSGAARSRWSDLDVQLVCTDVRALWEREDWLSAIGEVWVCLPLWNDGVIPTRLTWFAGGEKVDFGFVSVERLRAWADAESLTEEYQRGYRVLFDKDNLTAGLAPSPFSAPFKAPPTAKAFDQVVRSFWFEAIHVAQYIRARELWIVKLRDAIMKNDLLSMIEWHAQARHNWQLDTNRTGKYLAQWVDGDTWRAIHTLWPTFEPGDSWRALRESLVLFSRLAQETAERAGLPYDSARDRTIMAYVDGLYAEDELKG